MPDLIPEGLTLLAGKPKIGKSWLALDVCIAVALGRFCLGERKPVQGGVLYAAMEMRDSAQRGFDRGGAIKPPSQGSKRRRPG